MKLEVNIDKRYFFIFLAIGLIIVGIVGVIAYVSPPDWTKYPSDFGHSVNEIDWGQTINANLSVNGGVNVIGNVSAAMVCINGVCKGVWPTGNVSKIINGVGITISPLSGTGEVTISATSGGAIPSGMIAMFDASCPIGWTRFAALDGKFPYGSAIYGGTGGTTSHTHGAGSYAGPSHTHSLSVAGQAWNTNINNAVGTSTGASGTGAVTGTSASASSLPPYLEVVWCKKN